MTAIANALLDVALAIVGRIPQQYSNNTPIPRPPTGTIPSSGPATAVCTGASPINLGESIFANSTVTAKVPMGIKNVWCNSNYRTTGLWYQVPVVGDGGSMTATACRPETEVSTTISVFKDSCFSLEIECADWDDGVLSITSL